jgi:hypothetical protein
MLLWITCRQKIFTITLRIVLTAGVPIVFPDKSWNELLPIGIKKRMIRRLPLNRIPLIESSSGRSLFWGEPFLKNSLSLKFE